MRPHLLLTLLLAAPCAADEGTLLWTNGDKVPGEWLGLRDGWLEWKTQLLRDPSRLWLPRLYGWNAGERTLRRDALKGDWLVRLSDSSFFSATQPGSNNKTWTLTNPHAGDLKIAREAVVEWLRCQPAGPLRYAGPGGEPAWIPENPGKDPGQTWEMAPGGVLRTRSIDQAVSLPLILPARLRLDLWLRTNVKDRPPQFSLRIRRDGQGCEVVTWLEELVGRGDGMPARFSTLYEPRCAVVVCVDFKERQARAYDLAGREMMTWKVRGTMKGEVATSPGGKAGGLFGALAGAVAQGLVRQERANNARRNNDEIKEIENGLTLINTGADLTLERVLIREWDGQPPESRVDKSAFIELLDGRVLEGAITTVNAGKVRQESGKETSLDDVAWMSLQTLVAAADETFAAGTAAARARYGDASYFHGRLLASDTETLTCQPAWSAVPVTLRRQNLESLRWHEPEPLVGPLSNNHTHQDTLAQEPNGPRLRGRWVPAGDAKPHWRFDGDERASLINLNTDWSLQRPLPDPAAILEELPAMACLDNGEIIPVEILDWTGNSTRLRSPWSLDAKQMLPLERVRALELAGQRLQNNGFTDRGWLQVRGDAHAVTIAKDGKSVTLQPGGGIGHGSFLQGSQLNFALKGEHFYSLRLRLFTQGVQEKSPHIAILVSRSGDTAYCGVEDPRRPGQMTGNYHRIPLEHNKPSPVMLKWTAKQIEFHLAGMLAFRQNLTEKTASGTGLILEPGGMWGNAPRSCSVANLVLRHFPGARTRPALDPDTREWSLTVPRRLADDPPRHLLLAANGDVLRGTLETLDARRLRLRSGLETLEVPSERVSTLVLPRQLDQKDSKPSPAVKTTAAAKDGLWISTREGGRICLRVSSLGPRWLEGESTALGPCRLPVESVFSLSTLPPRGTQTAYDDWAFALTPEPELSGSTDAAKLVGKEAPDFKLELAGGAVFEMKKTRGKVVVLDFWASWCGPCLTSLPEVMAALREFPAERVQLLGINQGQPRAEVETFLKARDWDLACALDLDRKVSDLYGASAIPHTVIVAPDGKVARVQTGHTATSTAELVKAVRELIGE